MNPIQPPEMPIYEWKFEDSNDEAKVTFTIPEGLNVNIQYKTYSDNQSILVEAQFHIPYLCGTLAGKYESVKDEIKDNLYIIHIQKAVKTEWRRLIIHENKFLFVIDPKSALLLYKDYLMNPSSDYKQASQYLETSASVYFLPAVREYALILIKNKPTMNHALQLLQVGAEKYKDPGCNFHLGIILTSVSNMKHKAFEYLTFAAENGIADAMACLGEFYSPVSNIEYDQKDPEKALYWLNKANETEDNWVACHELAKMHLYGVGTEKNVKLAQDFQTKAKLLNKRCPSLIFETENKPSLDGISTSQILFGSAAAAAIAGFGALVYRAFRRK